MTGIYKISNKDNGKVYIGKSKDIMQRWSAHERALQANNHHSPKLQMDFNNYGRIEAFEIVYLLTFPKFGAILDTGNTK